MKPKKQTKKPKYFIEEPKAKSEFSAMVEHIQEHPGAYVAAVAVVIVFIIGGVVYSANTKADNILLDTAYARAIQASEKPEDALKGLEAIENEKGDARPRVLYSLGETAFEQKNYDKAKSAFEELRQQYADSAFTPDAVEGLGYILEEQGKDFAGAKALYEEIRKQWPNSFTTMRQPYNIARCNEQLGQLEDAIKSYEEQKQVFAESKIAEKAQAALDRLKQEKPELFPQEAAASPAAAANAQSLEQQVDSLEKDANKALDGGSAPSEGGALKLPEPNAAESADAKTALPAAAPEKRLEMPPADGAQPKE